MRILIAGASGVIGHALVKLLVASGHAVTGTTRSPARTAAIRAAGATPLVLNVFDAQPLADALAAARPEVVVHQLTDLPDRLEPGGLVEALARNARIRAEGTRNLVAAAVRAGTRRLVAQSIAWAYVPGTEPHHEDDPLDVSAEGVRGVTVRGVAELERLVTSVPRIDGLVLRTGRSTDPAPGARGRPAARRCTSAPRPGPPPSPSRAVCRASTTSWRTVALRPTRRRGPSSAGTLVSSSVTGTAAPRRACSVLP